MKSVDPKMKEIVQKFQVHNHSGSCRKYGTTCRYGFPKLPSKKTFLAKPSSKDLDPIERKQKEERNAKVLMKAREILESDDLNEKMTIDEFIEQLEVSDEEYHKIIGTMEKGCQLILQREVCERFVNNYNPEMLRAWKANMDIQLAFDPYSVVTYMINYVGKDESGMTKFLQEALNANLGASLEEKLKGLKLAYLKNKQISASEAVYRVLPSMHMKESNITTEFVQTGFPENRTVKYNCVDFEPGQSGDSCLNDEGSDEEGDPNLAKGDAVTITGKAGKYKKSCPIHER